MAATDYDSCLALYGSVPKQDFIDAAQREACAVGLNSDVFHRQINQESGYQPCIGSSAGAVGIAQIVPRFHPAVNPWNPWDSLHYAAQLMRSHLDNYGGSYVLALAAYNAGAGAVAEYGGVPPFDETHRYLTAILGPGWPEPIGLGTCPSPPPPPPPPVGSIAGVFLVGIMMLIGGLVLVKRGAVG